MTTRGPLAWVMNFDADDELAAGDRYAPTDATRARMAALVDRARTLLAPDDVVVSDAVAIENAAAYEGRAWCPTPSALARLHAAGVRVPRAPSIDVLRRVNHRRFSADLGQTLPGAVLATTIEESTRVIASRSNDENMLVKRAFGYAGRGRRKIYGGALRDDDARWIEASLRLGGAVQIEPLVAIDREHAIHGVVDESGALTLGAPTVQVCDEHGAWVSTAIAQGDDLSADERAALESEAHVVARALATAGYFGPFGVDAYRWRHARGAAFNPRGEINARHTMGFGVGMAHARRV